MPIVAISASDQTYLAQAVAAGAQLALDKPEGIDNLVSAIKQVLGGNYRRVLARAGVEAA